MSTATFRFDGALPKASTGAAASIAPRTSFLARFYAALIEARMRQAMRELAMHQHLIPKEEVRLTAPVPRDEVKQAGYKATYADAGLLPFVR